MGPWRGSMRPPNLGLPASIVSGYLIPPSVTDIRFWNWMQLYIAICAKIRVENNQERKMMMITGFRNLYYVADKKISSNYLG